MFWSLSVAEKTGAYVGICCFPQSTLGSVSSIKYFAILVANSTCRLLLRSVNSTLVPPSRRERNVGFIAKIQLEISHLHPAMTYICLQSVNQGCTYTTICLYCRYTITLAIRSAVPIPIPIFTAGCFIIKLVVIIAFRTWASLCTCMTVCCVRA